MRVLVRLAPFAAVLLAFEPGGSAAPASSPIRRWRLVDGRSWQIEAPALETLDETDAREKTRGACPAGMVSVAGRMKLDSAAGSIEELQKRTCTAWIDHRFPERCARFDPDAWGRLSRALPTRPMRFCIDRFEHPNERGAFPIIDVTWPEAGAACALEDKRLCTEDEWTFACEGEDALPYPYGYERDAEACVIDRPARRADERALLPRGGEAALREIDRLWQGEASGTRPRCRSPFGVYDLTGNVDEWTSSTSAFGHRSILKGGYWGPVRTRCRPSTRAHGEEFAFYQQGFRCCRDP